MSTQSFSSVKILLSWQGELWVVAEEEDVVSSSGQPKISGCS